MADSHKGLIFALLLDGNGGARSLNWDEINAWKAEDGQLWLHCEYSHRFAKTWLVEKSGLDKLTVAAMTIEESRPRAVITESGLLLFLRSVNLNPGQEPEDMVSIRMWLDKTRLITTRKRRLLSVQDVRESLEKNNGPKNVVDLMLTINDRMMDRIGDVLEQLDEQVDCLEDDVITQESRELRPKISNCRREAILLRRYLSPQREAFFRLYSEDSPWLGKVARLHLREVTDRLIRYVEDLDSVRDRAAITQEELMSRVSEQMDKRMYILSLVAVVFLPLSFITGLLGINVGGIPGAEHKGAFYIVCGFLLLIGVVQFFLFKRKKWI